MGKPSDTRSRIQAVARELFAEQGVQNTSLRQIADRLGITKPALYYHFSSREDLVRSIIQPLMDELETFTATRTPDSDARALLTDYFDLIWQHREVIMIVVSELPALADLHLVDRMFAWRKQLSVLLLGPDPGAAAQIRATVALGGLSDCVMEYGNALPDEIKAVAVEAALAALAC